jgi:predicted phage tail protein
MNTWQQQALHHAKTALPNESCGLVVDINGKEEYYPCNNIAIEGANSFTIDPEDWAKAEEMGTVLHICHSHPNSDLTASEEDIKNCNFLGLSWFIFDPENDECIELKPEVHKPMLTKEKFIDRDRTEDEKGLRKIKVYGRLAELVGWHVNYADVKNMKDVYKYLVCNYPEIEPHLKQNMYRITINNDVVKTKDDLLVHSEGEIRMIPIVSGAWFWIAAAFIGGGAAAAASSIAIVATLGSVLLTTGISMAVSGVTNMLFPQQQPTVGDVPQGLSETDARVNYSFSGIQNVSRSGVCIPLIYGEVFTGSIVVSSGTDTAPVYFGG